MLDAPLIWFLAIRLPWLFPGSALHRAGLEASAGGAYSAADALFERAARHYRVSLEVEALARLRVHQLIARARAQGDPGRDTALRLEVEQRLARLERIESLESPFDLVLASRLLASWNADPSSHVRAGRAASGSTTLHEAA